MKCTFCGHPRGDHGGQEGRACRVRYCQCVRWNGRLRVKVMGVQGRHVARFPEGDGIPCFCVIGADHRVED